MIVVYIQFLSKLVATLSGYDIAITFTEAVYGRK